MFLLPKEIGKFLRKHAPVIWIENPILLISISIALGFMAAIWQIILPEVFNDIAPYVITAITFVGSCRLGERSTATLIPLLLRRKNSLIGFEIDGVTKTPIKNYITKVLWRFTLLMSFLPSLLASGGNNANAFSFCLVAFAFSCISSYRLESLFFFSNIVSVAAIPVGVVFVTVYFILQQIIKTAPSLASFLISVFANAIFFRWRFRSWKLFSMEFWLAMGIAIIHLPSVLIALIYVKYFLFSDGLTLANPYKIVLTIYLFCIGPILNSISDNISARPGAMLTNPWRQI